MNVTFAGSLCAVWNDRGPELIFGRNISELNSLRTGSLSFVYLISSGLLGRLLDGGKHGCKVVFAISKQIHINVKKKKNYIFGSDGLEDEERLHWCSRV